MNRRQRRKVLVSHQLDRDAAVVQSGSLPRTVAVEEFVQARLREISVLKSALDNKVGANKRAAQDVPRHLRRRASSHNVYRLPARLRGRAKSEMEQQTLKPAHKPKRRERRRPSRMIQDHARRARKHVWLETHLWHAKRMRMDNIWGHRLAVRPTDKGQRATYKAAQHFATLYDASATRCLQVDGPVHLIVSRLQPFLPTHAHVLARSADECRNRSAILYERDQFPAGAIGPCDFVWSPAPGTNGIRSLWIWLHPAIADYVSGVVCDCFASFDDVHVQRAELVKFELLGSRCQSILSNCLRPAPSCSQSKTKMWKALSAIRSQSALPRGVCLGLDVTDPRTFSTSQHIPSVHPEGSDNRVRLGEPCLEEVISEWPLDLAVSDLWSEPGRDRAAASISDADNVAVPVVLIQRQLSQNRPHTMSGWDLVVPKGWAMALWKSLIFAGCRAIGLADRRNIYLEQGALHFPDDFPDTVACAMQSAFSAKLESDRHARTPKAKRVNFQANAIPSPFQPDWSQIVDCPGPNTCSEQVGELGVVGHDSVRPAVQVVRDVADFFNLPDGFCLPKALIRVSVEMRWGGVPHSNALVYAATADDRKAIEANSWPGIALAEIGADRPVIAIISTGGFLYSAGSGIGYGFASVSALSNASRCDCVSLPESNLLTDLDDSGADRPAIVLLRNTTSKHFQAAILRIAHH